MLLTIGFAVAAEDVRHFQLRAIHRAGWLEVLGRCGLDLQRNRARQQIQWARCGAHFAGSDAEIFCCGSQAAMAEEQLNSTNVGALLQQVNREGMTKRMRRDRFGDLANAVSLLTDFLNCSPTDVLAWDVACKEPVLGSFYSPPRAQNLQKLG